MASMWQGWRSALVALMLAVPSGPALACGCSLGGRADLLVMEAGLAFRGRVISVQMLGRQQEPLQHATVDVLQVWKGDLPARVALRASGPAPMCGDDFQPNEEFVIFANRLANGDLVTRSCLINAAQNAGTALARLGEQLAAADAAVQAAPGALGPLLARAGVLRYWRDYERALPAYRDLAAVAPDLISAQVGIARVLMASAGRSRDAILLLEQTRERLGDHPEIASAIGLARVRLGDLREVARVDFREADLTNVDLSRQQLRGADFSGAYLNGVRFWRSDLRGARFDGTRFSSVHMPRSDLRGARFVAPLGFPVLDGSDLRNARLERIEWQGSWQLSDIDMRGASIVESRFRGIDFVNINLGGARLTTVYMEGGTLSGSRLDGAVLRDVTFSRMGVARFDRFLANPRDLPGARLTNVRFQ